ncbi:hypothetical protein [Candidatus Harpocratesius sp.]
MTTRLKMPVTKKYHDFVIESDNNEQIVLKSIQICCPICQSPLVGEDGTKKRGKSRVQSYQCRNPKCSFLNNAKQGKQFTVYSSLFIKSIVQMYLDEIMTKLFYSQGKLIDIAKDYSISSSLMTYLSKKFQNMLDKQHGLQNLVEKPQFEHAVSIDETFLKINGISFYIIMATGYATHKVLGLKVSKTRTWEDIRDVFLEADQNSQEPLKVITADAWGGTKSCAKNLKRPITLIMHRHKKPFEDIVVKHYDYEENKRKITTIGVKSDFVKKKATREYYYMESVEDLAVKMKKKRGRKKGTKNGQGKKKKKPKTKKKRGSKGYRTVFDKGKRGYAKIDPYRKTVRVGKNILPAVSAALEEVINLYPKRFIQNNLAEHKNSLISNFLVLSGPKTAETIERKIRAFIICRNNPLILFSLTFNHNFQSNFLNTMIRKSPILKLIV